MFVDLSHTVFDGLVTYKGLPAPIICDYLSREASKSLYDEGTSFQIGKIDMVANTGTYIDSPFHRYEDGKDLSELTLDSLAGLEGVKITVQDSVKLIDHSFFVGKDLKNKAVLIQTNWSSYWNTEQYYEGHPFLTEDAAQYLKQQGAKLVGIDSYNIDDITAKERPVHSILLGSEILIVEHLCNLTALPQAGFTFYAVPVKVQSCGTFPVRAFAAVK